MQDLVFGLGRFLQDTFEALLVPFGNLPNVLFILTFAFGVSIWLVIQNKLNKKAKKDGTLI